jgi:hypothetical protein
MPDTAATDLCTLFFLLHVGPTSRSQSFLSPLKWYSLYIVTLYAQGIMPRDGSQSIYFCNTILGQVTLSPTGS